MSRLLRIITAGILCSALALPASALAAPKAEKAKESAKAAVKEAHAAKDFDQEAFRRNFVEGLKRKPNAPALTAADVRVDKVEKAAHFDGVDLYAVRGVLAPAGSQAQSFTMFVSADGRFYVSEVVDLEQGRSILKPARDKMLAEDLKTLGHTLTRGTGARTVVYVSDPFCPYCRQAFAYLMGKTSAFGEFRLAHFPLASHPGADIACALMAWAAQNAPGKALDFARFAYTDLPIPKPADKGPEGLKKAWAEVASAFLARFPELKALGADGEAIVTALSGSVWDASVQEDMAKAAAMNIDGTPIIFVDGARVEGFDQGRLNQLLK